MKGGRGVCTAFGRGCLTLFTVLLGILCYLGVGVYVKHYVAILYAPVDGETLASFLSKNERYIKFRREYAFSSLPIRVYTLNFKKIPRWMMDFYFPSSMPCYLFNEETGDFIDWNLDPGDNPSFVRRWQIPNM